MSLSAERHQHAVWFLRSFQLFLCERTVKIAFCAWASLPVHIYDFMYRKYSVCYAEGEVSARCLVPLKMLPWTRKIWMRMWKRAHGKSAVVESSQVEFILCMHSIHISLICQACHNNLLSSWNLYVEFEIWTDNRTTPSTKKDQRNWLALLSVHVPTINYYVHNTSIRYECYARHPSMLTYNLRNAKSGRRHFQKSIFSFLETYVLHCGCKPSNSPFILHAENIYKTSLCNVHFPFAKPFTAIRCSRIKTL